MTMLTHKTYLSASLTFAGLTAVLLTVVNYTTVQSKIGQVLAVLSGMTAMGAITYFQRYVEQNGRLHTADISFNEPFLSASISEAFKEIATEFDLKERDRFARPTWDLTPGQLVGTDNALALARLRIELEGELRRIALEAGIALSERTLGIANLARELVTAKILPAEFLEPLREVSDVCSRGIHGIEIPDDLAASVTRVGSQLTERLRLLPKYSQHIAMG